MFRSFTLLLATLLALVSAYSATQRTFAVNHFYGNGPLVIGRMDPIVDPGVPSGHVHAVQGGNAFALNMTMDQALSSTCTSSLVKNDKSNYWTPSLYFQNPNGTFTSVPMFYMNVYYFFEATTDKITAFQPGHRMLVGNPFLRSPPANGGLSITDYADGTPQPVQWVCPRQSTSSPLYPINSTGLDGAGIQDPTNAGAGVGFPDQNCDGYASPLRADIQFPSCYNPAVARDDYQNNMDWPTNGNCPEGWVHVPHLFYEVYWNTPLFADQWVPGQGKQPFVLSMGDPTGYGLHADFLSGWDPETLQQIIDNCNAGDSGMDKCPGLIGGLNDPSTSCNIACPVDEQVLGTLEQLPGNNPVVGWGDSVPGHGSTTSTASQSWTSASTVGQTVTAISQATSDSVPALQTSFVTQTQTPHSTATATTPSPTESTSVATNPVVSAWSYYGCYSDSIATGERVMTGIEFADVGQHAVTNTKCVTYCDGHGYSMAGTEYGGQCFCANDLAATAARLNDAECDMPCEGDAGETCGGPLALTVYQKSSTRARNVHDKHLRKHRTNVLH